MDLKESLAASSPKMLLKLEIREWTPQQRAMRRDAGHVPVSQRPMRQVEGHRGEITGSSSNFDFAVRSSRNV